MRAARTILSFAGVTFAVLAATRNDRTLGWIGIGLLILAIVLRMVDLKWKR